MKRRLWLFISALATASSGCSSGGGGGPAAFCPVNEGFAGAKVQVSSGTSSGEGSAPAPENALAMRNGAVLNSPSLVVREGTVLTALVSNRCERPGEIVAALDLDPSAQGLDGARSYPYRTRRDIDRAELESLASADPCLLGLSDTAVDSITGLPGDPLVPEQAHLASLGGADAYPVFYDASLGVRRPVVIAIVDTGVDIAHEDLRDAVWVNSGEIPGNGKDDDRNGYVDDVNGYNFAGGKADPSPEGKWAGHYHGTHVAGLAAAKGHNGTGVSGVMGAGARIMALNVFGASPGAFNYHTENAIRYAADNGAEVINLSIGGSSGSATYRAAIQYAVDRGASVFAAAGNERRRLGEKYFLAPGAYGRSIDGMMAVGSVDAVGDGWSLFSNYSPDFVEIAAPGAESSMRFIGLLSTMPGNSYSRLQGTSMSAPVVSGAAALAIQLLRARGYAPTPARIEAILGNSARVVSRLSSRVRGGRVANLKNIAEYIVKSFPVLSSPEPGAVSRADAGTVHPLVPCP